MTVKDLKEQLEPLDDSLEVIIQKDAEGNGYSPADGVELGYGHPDPGSTWRWEVKHPDDVTDADRPCAVIWPVN